MAGLYGRSESILRELKNEKYYQYSLNLLREIYVRERDWDKAIDSASDLETLAEDSEDIGQIEEKRSSKRRGKDRYIRFTSDGQTIDGMQDSDNLSEDEQERRQSMEVLHWASNEFKTVFERPPEHLTELLEFLDTGREQTEQAQGGESP